MVIKKKQKLIFIFFLVSIFFSFQNCAGAFDVSVSNSDKEQSESTALGIPSSLSIEVQKENTKVTQVHIDDIYRIKFNFDQSYQSPQICLSVSEDKDTTCKEGSTNYKKLKDLNGDFFIKDGIIKGYILHEIPELIKELYPDNETAVEFSVFFTSEYQSKPIKIGNFIVVNQASSPPIGGENVISQIISFSNAPTIITGGTGRVSAIASSGLPIKFASATPAVCSISDSGVQGVIIVTGLTTGSCIITANQPGNSNYRVAAQVIQTIKIDAAGNGSTDLCAGVPVPRTIIDYNLDSNLGGGRSLISPDPSFENYAVAAYRFTTTSNKYGAASFGFEDTIAGGDYFGKTVALSICPGDFTGIGVTAGMALPCYVKNSSPAGGIYYQVGAKDSPWLCKLNPGTQYYYNVKNSVQGTSMKYFFMSQPATNSSLCTAAEIQWGTCK